MNQMPDNQRIVPNHLGIILDGNRRWARKNNLSTLEGHRYGAENFRKISEVVFSSGVKYLSAYVFSTENWQRTQEEVGYLMGLLVKSVEKYLDDYIKSGIKIVILGRRDNLSKSVLKSIQKTEEKTKNNDKGCIALCFNYGGQDEIVDACKKIIESGVRADDIDRETIFDNLYHPELPEIDMIIRTSGENRLSGFMLWRSSYSELYFTSKYWPEFNEDELNKSFEEYSSRTRRFGK